MVSESELLQILKQLNDDVTELIKKLNDVTELIKKKIDNAKEETDHAERVFSFWDNPEDSVWDSLEDSADRDSEKIYDKVVPQKLFIKPFLKFIKECKDKGLEYRGEARQLRNYIKEKMKFWFNSITEEGGIIYLSGLKEPHSYISDKLARDIIINVRVLSSWDSAYAKKFWDSTMLAKKRYNQTMHSVAISIEPLGKDVLANMKNFACIYPGNNLFILDKISKDELQRMENEFIISKGIVRFEEFNVRKKNGDKA